MKKLLSLALILALIATLTTSVFADNVVGTHGTGNISDGVADFTSEDAETKVDITVTVGSINHRYAVDVEYTDISLSISGSDLTWDVNKLEYVSSGSTGLANATSTVTIKNYSDLPVYVTATVDDKDANDFISVTTDLSGTATVNKATAATAIDAGDGVPSTLEVTIDVTPTDGNDWDDVADYYTPKLTGGTNTLTAATVTITISKTNS